MCDGFGYPRELHNIHISNVISKHLYVFHLGFDKHVYGQNVCYGGWVVIAGGGGVNLF
jgi:hypothetical protein